MLKSKLLIAALLAASLGAVSAPASAAVSLYVDVAPPPPRYEVVPAPRAGFIWAPGYWDYRGGHHAWVKGRWEREQRGMYYHPSRWEQRDGRWYFERGNWNRQAMNDRDHDGIPNRADKDRDGDGVPNRYDRSPDNPHRQ
jgi:hypothetical protein